MFKRWLVLRHEEWFLSNFDDNYAPKHFGFALVLIPGPSLQATGLCMCDHSVLKKKGVLLLNLVHWLIMLDHRKSISQRWWIWIVRVSAFFFAFFFFFFSYSHAFVTCNVGRCAEVKSNCNFALVDFCRVGDTSSSNGCCNISALMEHWSGWTRICSVLLFCDIEKSSPCYSRFHMVVALWFWLLGNGRPLNQENLQWLFITAVQFAFSRIEIARLPQIEVCFLVHEMIIWRLPEDGQINLATQEKTERGHWHVDFHGTYFSLYQGSR